MCAFCAESAAVLPAAWARRWGGRNRLEGVPARLLRSGETNRRRTFHQGSSPTRTEPLRRSASATPASGRGCSPRHEVHLSARIESAGLRRPSPAGSRTGAVSRIPAANHQRVGRTDRHGEMAMDQPTRPPLMPTPDAGRMPIQLLGLSPRSRALICRESVRHDVARFE